MLKASMLTFGIREGRRYEQLFQAIVHALCQSLTLRCNGTHGLLLFLEFLHALDERPFFQGVDHV